MVLVEQGPWEIGDVDDNLRRIQDRLYDYVETALDGHLTRRYPDAAGQPIWIRVDCYDTPDEPIRSFLARIESHLRASHEFRQTAVPLTMLHFEYNWRQAN